MRYFKNKYNIIFTLLISIMCKNANAQKFNLDSLVLTDDPKLFNMFHWDHYVKDTNKTFYDSLLYINDFVELHTNVTLIKGFKTYHDDTNKCNFHFRILRHDKEVAFNQINDSSLHYLNLFFYIFYNHFIIKDKKILYFLSIDQLQFDKTYEYNYRDLLYEKYGRENVIYSEHILMPMDMKAPGKD